MLLIPQVSSAALWRAKNPESQSLPAPLVPNQITEFPTLSRPHVNQTEQLLAPSSIICPVAVPNSDPLAHLSLIQESCIVLNSLFLKDFHSIPPKLGLAICGLIVPTPVQLLGWTCTCCMLN